MEETTSFKDAISAIDGLLACLIYLDEAGSQMPASYHHDLCHQIDRYWGRLGEIASTHPTPRFTALFNSFNCSTHFYEVAFFTFRNVLVGAKPDSLKDIFSLCSLSYIASRCLRSHESFRDIEVWRIAIRDPQDRQTFSDLAGIVWSQVPQTTDNTLMHTHTPILAFNPLDGMQDKTMFSDISNSFWDLDAISDLPAPIGIEENSPTSSSLEDLQGSAIVSNLICFLTECGDLLHVFSGRGVTTKDLYSCISFTQGGSEAKKVVNACVKRLKDDEACQIPSSTGILAIVERFVALGYLQTLEELRKYMLCVGRRVILEDEAFTTFCQSVCESTATVSRPPTPSWATPPRGGGRRRGPRSIRGREIPCDVCGQLFSRTYNKNRHIETKHPWFQINPDANSLVQGSVRLT